MKRYRREPIDWANVACGAFLAVVAFAFTVGCVYCAGLQSI
ncbi:hypothetical protein [Paracoccus yeei]|nr:hypothetical protein [Paracoccus yeei]